MVCNLISIKKLEQAWMRITMADKDQETWTIGIFRGISV